MKTNYFKSPWVEALVMLGVMSISTLALLGISFSAEAAAEGVMSTPMIVGFLGGFFLLSFCIALIAVMAGIGGGVLFTPIMLAFTSVDSLVIRATGLIVAMFSGLISTGIFMRRGLGNLKMVTLLAVSQGAGALIGAQGAIFIYDVLGQKGEAAIRLLLGFILTGIAVYFLRGGKKLAYPDVGQPDRFTRWLHLSQSYYEESEGRFVSYQLTRAALGLFSIFFVGLIGGFFGMGGGWAITPVQNLVMGAPLKVAAANSGIILGMVDCIAVWPYILIGALIPLFVLPWLSGQVLGGYLGSILLVRIKVDVIRLILIGIMFFTSFSLVSRGLELFNVIDGVPHVVSLLIFLIVSILVVVSIFNAKKRRPL